MARDLKSSPEEVVGFRFPGETRNRQEKSPDKGAVMCREGWWKEVEREVKRGCRRELTNPVTTGN